ncbi:MAG: glycerate kinase [Spirochaetaceae bacterium]|nr:glycerate kinase [Spirochaetaceae bacterium]
MKIVIAPDSFKESLTAEEACRAIEEGFKKIFSQATYAKVPMADGGEGTMEALVSARGGHIYEAETLDPLGKPIKAVYAILGDGQTAVIEMAKTSGLALVPREERNPLITTTYGTGQLIKAALDKGATNFLVTIGGSATNDGGVGMVQALGGHFYDKEGKELAFGGGELGKLVKIDLSRLDNRLSKVTITAACDVDNPLTGPRGASRTFGPQKGATPEGVELLDANLKHLAGIIKSQLGKDIEEAPGAGAAGGIGGGLMAFANAKLERGVNIVAKAANLEETIKNANLVITAEGGMDFQTRFGKTPYGVAQVAKKYNLPVIALVGTIGKEAETLYEHGFDAIFSIVPGAVSLEEALKDGFKNLANCSENVARLIKATGGLKID